MRDVALSETARYIQGRERPRHSLGDPISLIDLALPFPQD